MPAPEPRCPGGGDHVLSPVDETPDGEILECVVDGCLAAFVVPVAEVAAP